MFWRILENGLNESCHDPWRELCEVLGFMRKAVVIPTTSCHNPTTTPRPHFHKPAPAAASEPMNRHVMPESHKHPQERPITDRSGQQSGEIAAGGPEAPGGLPGAKTRTASTILCNQHSTQPEDGCTKILIAGESYNEVQKE